MPNRDTDQTTLANALQLTERVIAAGYVLLPAAPTATMLAAGAAAGNLSPEQISQIYRAMHHAAAQEGSDATSDPYVLLQQLVHLQKMN
jgi:alkanesulfonate monooxygenase SsuD/methylene tetrahydromethanopterin reductase-like flavin-dependent oxidoreductase (luciferase family)